MAQGYDEGAIIHITDGQSDDIVDYITASNFWDDTHSQELEDYKETFEFSTFADKSFSAYLGELNRIIIPGEDADYREFIIDEIGQYHDNDGLYMEVKATGSFKDLQKAKVMKPEKIDKKTANGNVSKAVSNTEWEIGKIQTDKERSFEIDKHKDPFSFLKTIANEYDMELRFRVTTNGRRVTGRYVDLLDEVGDWEGREVTFGRDLKSIERVVDTDDLVTALLVIGPGDENENRKEVTVEDEDALKRWGRRNPKTGDLEHLIEKYEPDSNDRYMSEDDLKKYGKQELKKRIEESIDYKTTIEDLEHVPGLENKKIRFGSTIKIKDEFFKPPLYLEARVHKQDRSIKDKSQKDVELGDYTEYTEEEVNEVWLSMRNDIRRQMKDYAEKKVHIGVRPPEDKDRKWLDTSGKHDRWKRYDHDSEEEDEIDRWITDDQVDGDTFFGDDYDPSKKETPDGAQDKADDALDDAKDYVDDEIKDAEHNIDKAEENISDLKDDLDDLEADVYDTQQDLDNLGEDFSDLESDFKDAQDDIDNSKENLSNLKDDLNNLDYDNENLVSHDAGKWEQGYIDSDGEETDRDTSIRTDFIEVEGDKTYTLTAFKGGRVYVCFYDDDKKIKDKHDGPEEGDSETYKLDENIKYVRFFNDTKESGNENDVKPEDAGDQVKIKFEKGKKSTSWKPAVGDVVKGDQIVIDGDTLVTGEISAPDATFLDITAEDMTAVESKIENATITGDLDARDANFQKGKFEEAEILDAEIEDAIVTGEFDAKDATFKKGKFEKVEILDAEIEDAVITGTLDGVDGRFTGELNGVDGNFKGTVKGGSVETYSSAGELGEDTKLEMEGGEIKGYISKDNADEGDDFDEGPEGSEGAEDDEDDDSGDDADDDDDAGEGGDDFDEEEDTEFRLTPLHLSYNQNGVKSEMRPRQISVKDGSRDFTRMTKNGLELGNGNGLPGIDKFLDDDRNVMVLRGELKGKKYGSNIYLYGNNDKSLPGALRLFDGTDNEKMRMYKGYIYTYGLIRAEHQEVISAKHEKAIFYIKTNGKMDFAAGSGHKILAIRDDIGSNNDRSIQLPAIDGYTSGGTANLHVTSHGNIKKTKSTRKIKKDITDVSSDDADNFIENATPVYFTSVETDEEDNIVHYGYIAEDMAGVDERLVARNSDDEPDSVEYDRIVGLLQKAIIKDREKIADLESRLDKLEK